MCIGVCILKIEQLIIGAVYGSLAVISMFVGILVLRIRLNSTRHLELEKMWQNKRRHDITDTMKTVKKQMVKMLNPAFKTLDNVELIAIILWMDLKSTQKLTTGSN